MRMSMLNSKLEEDMARIRLGGGEEARKRHLSRNKLLPRDRIEAVLDSGLVMMGSKITEMVPLNRYIAYIDRPFSSFPNLPVIICTARMFTQEA
jgi:acetyl-CoA carboxylase carboxyltransferase component